MYMHFFLGTNGPYGFFSYAGELIDYDNVRQVNILKGTPGCGKSTFMTRIAGVLATSSTCAEFLHCSSDPDSLDGLLFPEKGVVFVDGTAPHVFEPTCPGAVDLYVNLARFKNISGLVSQRKKLEMLLAANKLGFSLATPWIHSASLLEDTAHKRVISEELTEKIKARGKSLCYREIPKAGRAAVRIEKRFLSAVTPDGLVCRFDTVTDNFERVIALDDNYGLAGLMLPELVNYAAGQGFRTYACYHPLHPDRIEHVLIPELRLAFVTNSNLLPYPVAATRHIRLDSCIPADVIRSRRSGLRFVFKTRNSCLQEAVGHLKDAKLVHDELENVFKSHIDFAAVEAIAEEKQLELLKM